MWPGWSKHVYHCNLVTHNFKFSNENSSGIVYDVHILDNPFSEQNYLARTVEVKSLEISFPPHSFSHPSLTSWVIYVSCKHIISYFLSLKYVNTDFRFNFDRSPRTLTENNWSVQSQAIRKVRGQKQKSVTQKANSSQRQGHSSGLWRRAVRGVTCLTRVSQSGVFSGQARATRGTPGIRPRPLGHGVTCALLKVQLCLFCMHSCQLSVSVRKFCLLLLFFPYCPVLAFCHWPLSSWLPIAA